MPIATEEVQKVSEAEPWPGHFNTTLAPFLSESAIAQLKQMWLEGPEPPRVSDNGWAGRAAKTQTEGEASEGAPAQGENQEESSKSSRVGRGGRGRRGGKADGRKGRGGGREDNRKVITEVGEEHFHFVLGVLREFSYSR